MPALREFALKASQSNVQRRTPPRPLQAGCEVCILAGGLSVRMGRDKARLRLGRHTLLGLIRKTALDLGLPVRVIRRDRVPRCGPLGGVYTALVTSRAEALLFLSCDMPFVSAELLRALIARMKQRVQALFVAEDDLVGFPFILRRDALPIVEKQLAARQFSLQKLARRLHTRLIRLPRRFQPLLFNVNTPAEWAAAQQRFTKGASAGGMTFGSASAGKLRQSPTPYGDATR